MTGAVLVTPGSFGKAETPAERSGQTSGKNDFSASTTIPIEQLKSNSVSIVMGN